MLKNIKPKIIAISIITLVIVGAFGYVNYLINKSLNIEIPKQFIYNNKTIALNWTDDNTGEDLIIQSDKKEYNGFNSVDVYFSITNINKQDQDMDVVVWVGDEKIRVEEFLKIQDTKNKDTNKLQIQNYKSQINLKSKIQNRKDIKNFTTGYSVNDNIESGETNYYKATIKYPPMSKGEFFVEAFGMQKASKSLRFALANRSDLDAYGHLDPWYSSNWKYKRQIIINSSQVATTTDAFPVLATTTLSDLKTVANGGKVGSDSGYDIVFVDDDESTVLNYEREKYASTTGEIVYWIKTDISFTTDKTIYMYYGNSGASDLATTTGVWDDNYVMVQHMNEEWDATSIDSTQYNNDGTHTNFYSATSSVDAQIDGGIDFDGADDYVNISGYSTSDNESFSAFAWVNPAVHANYKGVISSLQGGPYPGYNLYIHGDGTLGTYLDSHRRSVEIISLNKWSYIGATFNNGALKLYINGSQKRSDSGCSYTGSNFLKIACFYADNPSLLINAVIDEVRISNTARHAGWIETEYNNQSDVGSFMTFYEEGTGPPAEVGQAVSDLSSGLVGHWKFSEGSGSTVADSSGNGNTGTWNGSGDHWTAEGRFGSGGEFDGVGDYVDAGDFALMTTGGSDIVAGSVWIKSAITNYPTSAANQYGIVSKHLEFLFGVTDEDDFTIGTYGGNIDGESCGSIDLNWHHYVFIYDEGANTGKIYQDGSLLCSGALTDDSADGNNFYISRMKYTDSSSFDYFRGKIDEVRIYNRALSQREIVLLYNNGRTAAEWHFKNNYKDTGSWCEVSNSNCKNLTAGGSGNQFTTGFLEEATSALSLSGAGYANLADDPVFDIASSADFSLIATLKTVDTNNSAIISKRTDSAAGSAGWLFGLDYGQGDGVPYFEVSDGANEFSVYGSESVADNSWQTVGVVFDESSASGCKIYIDGLDKTGGTSGTIASVGDLSNAIALNVSRTNDGSGLFTGEIDRIGFFPYAMNLDDVLKESAGGHIVKIGHNTATKSGGSTWDPFGGDPPVAWWKMDEMSGTVAADYASSSSDGTWHGSGDHHVNGKIGYAGQFDGVGDYVEISDDNNSLDLGNYFSVSFWIYTGELGNTIVLEKGDGWNSDLRYYFFTDYGGSGGIQYGIKNNWVWILSDPINDSQWHHIVATYDNGTAKIYSDGGLDATDTGWSMESPTDIGVFIGARSGGSVAFDGTIDEVRIYDYARTQAQVAWDYNQGKPVAHWKFDENSSGSADGASLIDSSGNGNTGTGVDGANDSGLNWTDGKVWYGLEFDGEDDYVDCGNAASLNITGSLTVSVWVKADAFGEHKCVASKWGGNDNARSWDIIAIEDASNNYWRLRVQDASNVDYTSQDPTAILTGQWYHLVGVYDQSAERIYLYVDGSLIDNDPAGTSLDSVASDVYIGAMNSLVSPADASIFEFNGTIDDVRIYNYARTADQILEDYNNGARVRFGE